MTATVFTVLIDQDDVNPSLIYIPTLKGIKFVLQVVFFILHRMIIVSLEKVQLHSKLVV